MIKYSQDLNELKKTLLIEKSTHPFLKDINLPFIPNFSANFGTSKNKVIVVGQETAGWGKQNLDSFVLGDLTTENLISDSKNRYSKYYGKLLTNSVFLRFINKVIEKNHNDDVQWLNFYICAYKKQSFNQLNKNKENIDLYNKIKEFSINNLTKQLNRLEPKNIFFLGAYHNNWNQLKSSYVREEEILSLNKPVKGFSLRFWNNTTLVIRVPHPRSHRQDKNDIHNKAITYFEIFNNEADQDPEKFKILIRNDLV